MRKVEYVLFADALTFEIPRGGDHDYYSLADGPDPRYDIVKWSLWFDDTISCIVVGCKDQKTGEEGKVMLVPVVNCRQIRLSKIDLPVETAVTDADKTESQ